MGADHDVRVLWRLLTREGGTLYSEDEIRRFARWLKFRRIHRSLERAQWRGVLHPLSRRYSFFYRTLFSKATEEGLANRRTLALFIRGLRNHQNTAHLANSLVRQGRAAAIVTRIGGVMSRVPMLAHPVVALVVLIAALAVLAVYLAGPAEARAVAGAGSGGINCDCENVEYVVVRSEYYKECTKHEAYLKQQYASGLLNLTPDADGRLPHGAFCQPRGPGAWPVTRGPAQAPTPAGGQPEVARCTRWGRLTGRC